MATARDDDASAMVHGLHVVDRGRATERHPAPLLFVHGAWHAAWCWDEHFLRFFAERGYRAVALSLRGHGDSPSAKPLRNVSFSDYVSDVNTVAASLPRRPVVVGHSMGGHIVQKYLERHEAPAAVLIASTPPRGFLASGIRWLRRHPWHFTKMVVTGKSLAYVSTPPLARERFFSPRTPDADVLNCARQLQEEGRRLGVEGVFVLPRPARISTPVLVIGAIDDGAVTTDEVRATARAYRTDAELFADMGHNMMLEPGWSAVAHRIDDWLGTQEL